MLTGQHVGLRSIELDDLPQLLIWRNNPELRKYFREYRELGFEQQKKWYEKFVIGDPNTIMFAIVDLNDKRLLGACGLCYINWIDRDADFSIYIGADDLYIDDKYAQDASRTIMKYAFDELCIHRLWTEIYDIDLPKKKMFNDLGFSLDGTHRQTYWYEGRWHDSLFFSFLNDEYYDQKSK